MQNVSKAYKDSMRSPFRNRGYIRVTIGVINSEAQKNVDTKDSRNQFEYYSDIQSVIDGCDVEREYATCEQNLSKVDGSFYFLPPKGSGYKLYNNGIVTKYINGSIYFGFQCLSGLDIKGLTIDFGDCYPEEFEVRNDENTRLYTNNQSRRFSTEDVFNGTSYIIITPIKMANEQSRLRIYKILFGIVNVFVNKNVKDYSSKDFVSPISETIPSNDVSITVDNQNLYYSPDNPNSAIAFMEVGQEVKTEFGYDSNGDGNIEWLPPTTTYLKSWTANDVDAKFTSTDRFDYLTGTYQKGIYRTDGISLYDLAVDVFEDAGIKADEYFIDPYLKTIIVNNPLPPVKHSEALQLIANAGRSVLFEDRKSRIHLQSSFVPEMTASVNNETEYSNGANLLVNDKKDAYAIASNDFSVADGSIFFMPSDTNYLNTGYISGSIADENGLFSENPKITIQMETGYVAYRILIKFRNVAAKEFSITTYYNNEVVNEITVINPETIYNTSDRFDLFDRMVLEFKIGNPNSRIAVDNVIIGDATDYLLSRNNSLTDYPTTERLDKVKEISVSRKLFGISTGEIKELVSGEVVVNSDSNTLIVPFSNPSYGFVANVTDNTGISVQILKSGCYFVELQFSNVTDEKIVKYSVSGFEYIVSTVNLTKKYNTNGEVVKWENPLISDNAHALDIQEWLSSYFLGDIEYHIKWRGDPSVDANDLFYLELKNSENVLIRNYQNELKYNGAWSGTMKSRKVV